MTQFRCYTDVCEMWKWSPGLSLWLFPFHEWLRWVLPPAPGLWSQLGFLTGTLYLVNYKQRAEKNLGEKSITGGHGDSTFQERAGWLLMVS